MYFGGFQLDRRFSQKHSPFSPKKNEESLATSDLETIFLADKMSTEYWVCLFYSKRTQNGPSSSQGNASRKSEPKKPNKRVQALQNEHSVIVLDSSSQESDASEPKRKRQKVGATALSKRYEPFTGTYKRIDLVQLFIFRQY